MLMSCLSIIEEDQYVADYAAAWEANFVYDTIIFILTIAKTWEGRQGISGQRSTGLFQLMLRDGNSCSICSPLIDVVRP